MNESSLPLSIMPYWRRSELNFSNQILRYCSTHRMIFFSLHTRLIALQMGQWRGRERGELYWSWPLEGIYQGNLHHNWSAPLSHQMNFQLVYSIVRENHKNPLASLATVVDFLRERNQLLSTSKLWASVSCLLAYCLTIIQKCL